MIIVSHKSFENYGYCLLRRNHHCGRLVVTSGGFALVASCTVMFKNKLNTLSELHCTCKIKTCKAISSNPSI